MRNIMISHVNKILAESDGFAPVRVSLCHDSGVADMPRWQSMNLKARQEIFASVLTHFRNHGYTVRSLGQDDVIEISHGYPSVISIVETQSIVEQFNQKKISEDIPKAITKGIELVNEHIRAAASKGAKYYNEDLLSLITYLSDTHLNNDDMVIVVKHVYDIVASEGYYVHLQDYCNGYCARIGWDDADEAEYLKMWGPPSPMPEPKKKRGLFGKKN